MNGIGVWKTLTPTLSRGERGKRRSPGGRGGIHGISGGAAEESLFRENPGQLWLVLPLERTKISPGLTRPLEAL